MSQENISWQNQFEDTQARKIIELQNALKHINTNVNNLQQDL